MDKFLKIKSIKLIIGFSVIAISIVVFAFWRSDLIHFYGKINPDASSAFSALLALILTPVTIIVGLIIFSFQNKQTNLQIFDGKFSTLINNYYLLTSCLELGEDNGKSVLKKISIEFKTLYDGVITNEQVSDDAPSYRFKNIAKDKFDHIYITYNDILSNYFENIFFAIDSFDKSENINSDEKKYYVNQFRSHLNSHELRLLYFYSVSYSEYRHRYREKFYHVLSRYSFFEIVSEGIILNRRMSEIYPTTLFRFLTDDEVNIIKNRINNLSNLSTTESKTWYKKLISRTN